MTFTQTEQNLSKITDEGLFEKLATAILRDAEYAYRAMIHTGTNVDGKTIKSPVDGILYGTDRDHPHLYVVHHTITARSELGKKWLHDPATVRTRGGRKPTAPEGDVLKAINIIARERRRISGLQATLILTTNQEPDVDTIRDAIAAGVNADICLDIWTRSRLAHFLDNSAQGQWLRHQYLGSDVEFLSRDALLKLSDTSLRIHAPRDLPNAWVSRRFDNDLASALLRATTFVVAPSGFGKSVASYKWLAGHIAQGAAGLVLPHEAVANALTISDALDSALRQLCPSLRPGTGADALALSSIEQPLYLVVEDVNRSGQAAQLAERIESWARTTVGSSSNVKHHYRLLCPIWPEVITVMGEEARKAVSALAIFGSSFTSTEGRNAVQRRAALGGHPISDMTADTISGALGHDPLLIALHNPSKVVEPNKVIGDFVEETIERVALTQRDYTAADYHESLCNLAGEAFKHRELNPLWTDVRQWSGVSAENLRCLSHLFHDGKLAHLTGRSAEQRVAYRHDRVRDWLLIDAANGLAVEGALDSAVLGDPYFAEVIGGVIARRSVDTNFISRVRAESPLALFYALRSLSDFFTSYYKQTLMEIEEWLSDPSTHNQANEYLRWEALAALAYTDGPDVLRIVSLFKSYGGSVWQARLRNGDVGAAIELCSTIEPGVGAPWRDIQLDHMKQKFGAKLVRKLDELLRRPDLNAQTRMGMLRLAGHLADPTLGEAIMACWEIDAERKLHLADYIWASSECCGIEPERYLDPVCAEWAQLPMSEDDKQISPTRDSLVENQVRWAFRKWVPTEAIRYFVKRAEADDLRWPITYMLEEIDDPVAVIFVVQEVAEMTRRIEGTKSFSPFGDDLPRAWRRRQEECGVGMSEASRDPLRVLWTDPTIDKHLRKAAFKLWAATYKPDDLALLGRPSHPADLEDEILHERLLRADRTAVPALLKKISKSEHIAFWWHTTKYVWSEDLLSHLDTELGRCAAQVKPEWNSHSDNDYATSDVIMRLSPEVGEKLLEKYWDKLRYVGNFIHAAIYLGTPNLLNMVKKTIEECPDPKSLLDHLGHNVGINMHGHPGITREAQIASLSPYLSYMSQYHVMELWEICNRTGWLSTRSSFLDQYIDVTFGMPYQDETKNFAQLDGMAESKQGHRIDYWLESYGKTGATTDMIIGQIGRWFSLRKTLAALKLVRQALIQIGRRSDLAILETPLDIARPTADEIRADTVFGVKRRTLH